MGEVTYSTNLNLSVLPAGDYTFGAEDASGQTASVSFTILDRPETCGCTHQAFNYDLNARWTTELACSPRTRAASRTSYPTVLWAPTTSSSLVEFGVVCE